MSKHSALILPDNSRLSPKGEDLAPGVSIWLGDFREVFPASVREVSHIITDAPYEQRSHDATGGIRRADGIKSPSALTFEGIDHMREDAVVRAKMICSGWFLSFCTTEGVSAWRDEIERQGLKYKTPMIWVKPDAMPKFNAQGPSHGHECLISAWCGTGYSKWNGGGKRGVFTHFVNPVSRDGRHPTEKPLSLMCELITLFTNPGDLVADFFMGSGSTALACIKLGRRFVGCELNQTYYAVARERINLALSQKDFFNAIIPQPQTQFKMDV